MKMDATTRESSISYPVDSSIEIENENDLFQLYTKIIPKLKELESICQKKEQLEKENLDAMETVQSRFFLPIASAITFTIVLAIPFVILFLIVTNIVHTPDGTMTLFKAYDKWIEHAPVFGWILNASFGENLPTILAVILSLVYVLFSLFIAYVVAPCVLFLFPVMLIFGIIHSFFAIGSAKNIMKNADNELPRLGAQIDGMIEQLNAPITFVPPDYRYSAALEHFCRSYYNQKASTLKEAIILYDNHLHQLRMEQGQQEILEAQNDLLRKLDYQSAKINSLEKDIKHVRNKVDWWI